MQIFFTGLGVASSFGIVAMISLFQDMTGNEKLPFIGLLVFLAAYSLIKIGQNETKSVVSG
jgi:hypothetical protein